MFHQMVGVFHGGQGIFFEVGGHGAERGDYDGSPSKKVLVDLCFGLQTSKKMSFHFV